MAEEKEKADKEKGQENADASSPNNPKGGNVETASSEDPKTGEDDEAPPSPPVSSKSQRSILSNANSGSGRTDAHGNPIEKGSKQHRLTFRDEVEKEPLQEVQEVTVYKQQYMNDAEKQGCTCTMM
eukprot:TRINITY_DN66416_c0_g1_i1.p1 TRINITY_DN66416_c0_g1~~TRINITY_DN66416_c0_g1_i1.p1  ORF type:complete len:126 (-),score=34.53 TRINITY_DN66416_c0_g1_i1:202-579(-)